MKEQDYFDLEAILLLFIIKMIILHYKQMNMSRLKWKPMVPMCQVEHLSKQNKDNTESDIIASIYNALILLTDIINQQLLTTHKTSPVDMMLQVAYNVVERC